VGTLVIYDHDMFIVQPTGDTVVYYDCNMYIIQPTGGTLVNYVCIMFIVLVTAVSCILLLLHIYSTSHSGYKCKL